MPPPYTLGAFAVILDDQRHVLLCHRRDRDVWNLPGGGVESRELPSETVIRETKEETGLAVAVDRLIGLYGKADRDDLVFVFLCSIIGGALTTTDEADEQRFFNPAALPQNLLARSWHIERINDALSGNMQPVFRRQIRAEAG